MFGIQALRAGTTKKGCAITGIVAVGIYLAMMVAGGIALAVAALTGQI